MLPVIAQLWLGSPTRTGIGEENDKRTICPSTLVCHQHGQRRQGTQILVMLPTSLVLCDLEDTLAFSEV